jgi:AraC-like DNA-binding protein
MNAPWEWKIISSLFPSDVPSVVNQRHWEWYRKGHVDRHPHREVLIGLTGECHYGFKDRIYPCLPGTVVLFNSFEEHDSYYAPTTSGVTHLWLHLVKDHTSAHLYRVDRGQIQAVTMKSCILRNYEWGRLLDQCWTALQQPGTLAPATMRLKLITVLFNAAQDVIERDFQDTTAVGRGESGKNAMEVIRQHIRETAGRGLKLDNLAQIAGYSKFHFLRLFQQHTGQSVHSYIDECRRQTVRNLEREGRMKKQIAEVLGFSCLAAYSRWYKTAGHKK